MKWTFFEFAYFSVLGGKDMSVFYKKATPTAKLALNFMYRFVRLFFNYEFERNV